MCVWICVCKQNNPFFCCNMNVNGGLWIKSRILNRFDLYVCAFVHHLHRKLLFKDSLLSFICFFFSYQKNKTFLFAAAFAIVWCVSQTICCLHVVMFVIVDVRCNKGIYWNVHIAIVSHINITMICKRKSGSWLFNIGLKRKQKIKSDCVFFFSLANYTVSNKRHNCRITSSYLIVIIM